MLLKSLDVELSVEKKEFTKLLKARYEKLAELQRELQERQIPTIIVIEGWFGSGKGEVINSILQALDPRGFKLCSGYNSSSDAFLRPFFWQYWLNLPAKGQFALFERSWYHRTVMENFKNDVPVYEASVKYTDINDFENSLIYDNATIIKFFLNVSEKHLKKRVRTLSKKIQHIFEITDYDAMEIENYDHFFEAYQDMIRQTNTNVAPWIIVEADDLNYAKLKTFDYLINLLSERLNITTFTPHLLFDKPILNDTFTQKKDSFANIDLKTRMLKIDYEDKLSALQEQLKDLQFELYRKQIPVVLAFEGWDAAGKGGAIRRLTIPLDPRIYYVIPIAAPTSAEKSVNYLARFWRSMPRKGHIAIFDRSWYGRVLVERVEKFATEQEWRRAYSEINKMEAQLVHDEAIVCKFWIHIDKDEQYKRFKEREVDPKKEWKLTEEDWRNREKWDLYQEAANDMFAQTNTKVAPWVIVAGNCKYSARIQVIKTVISQIEKKLGKK